MFDSLPLGSLHVKRKRETGESFLLVVVYCPIFGGFSLKLEN